jgi:hypothetical protein
VSDPAAPLVALARSEFEMHAAQNDNYDLIGLGVATFALALGGINVALKGDLGQLWFLPWVPVVVAIVLSIGCSAVVMWSIWTYERWRRPTSEHGGGYQSSSTR